MEIESVQRRMVEQIVSEQFMPEVVATMQNFMREYHHKVAWETEYRIVFGQHASLPVHPVLDLRPAQERLIRNVMYAITNTKN